MNFMGMGLAEIAVVFVVAFLVLGPNRAIGLARSAGKIFGDLRRTFAEVASAASLEQQGEQRGNFSSPVDSQPVPQPQPAREETASDSAGSEEPTNSGPSKNGDE